MSGANSPTRALSEFLAQVHYGDLPEPVVARTEDLFLDWFASALDLNTGGGVLLTLDDLTDTERYSASARTVTANFTTAPTGNGTTGEAWVYIGYLMASK